jgi:predicted methyltransferase
VVGEKGRVFAVVTSDKGAERIKPVMTAHPNVSVSISPLTEPTLPPNMDVVWTTQNYHDVHNVPGADLAKFNAAVFRALKPGGVYLVLDHAAAAGSGLRDTNTLHRIDEETVKHEVEAAGFKLDGESKVLRNPADDHTIGVTDDKIRHHTDQFVLRFRKPRH